MLHVELLPLVVDACYQPEIVPANINCYPSLGSAVLEQVDVFPKMPCNSWNSKPGMALMRGTAGVGAQNHNPSDPLPLINHRPASH